MRHVGYLVPRQATSCATWPASSHRASCKALARHEPTLIHLSSCTWLAPSVSRQASATTESTTACSRSSSSSATKPSTPAACVSATLRSASHQAWWSSSLVPSMYSCRPGTAQHACMQCLRLMREQQTARAVGHSTTQAGSPAMSQPAAIGHVRTPAAAHSATTKPCQGVQQHAGFRSRPAHLHGVHVLLQDLVHVSVDAHRADILLQLLRQVVGQAQVHLGPPSFRLAAQITC